MIFGFLLFPELEELDLVGPWEMITVWSKYAQGPEICLMAAETLAPVVCAKGMSLNPHTTFDQCPPLDYLLIPGGQGTRQEVNHESTIRFITHQTKNCRAVLSVCTGSFLLQRAGLLSGKRATTHWGSLERLRGIGDVDVVEERIVNDGNIWTSAGISAGIDLALAFIAHEAGEEAAGRVQYIAEYYPSGATYGRFHKEDAAPQYLKRLP